MKPVARVVTFAEVKPGELFRGLRPDRVKNGQELIEGKWVVKWREVASDGLYIKISNTIAVDIAHGNKDCILSLRLPCRVLPKTLDGTHLEAYKVYHRYEPRTV